MSPIHIKTSVTKYANERDTIYAQTNVMLQFLKTSEQKEHFHFQLPYQGFIEAGKENRKLSFQSKPNYNALNGNYLVLQTMFAGKCGPGRPHAESPHPVIQKQNVRLFVSLRSGIMYDH